MKHLIMASSLAFVFAVIGISLPTASADTNTTLGEQGLSDAQVADIKETINVWTQDLIDDNFETWAAHWAEGGALLPPGHDRIIGRDNLIAYMKKTYDSVEKLTFSDWDVVGRDDLAVVTNNVRFDLKVDSGGPIHIKQIIVLRLHDDGEWMVQSVIFNMDSQN